MITTTDRRYQRRDLGWMIAPHAAVAHYWRARTDGDMAISRCHSACRVSLLRSATDQPRCYMCALLLDILPQRGGDKT